MGKMKLPSHNKHRPIPVWMRYAPETMSEPNIVREFLSPSQAVKNVFNPLPETGRSFQEKNGKDLN